MIMLEDGLPKSNVDVSVSAQANCDSRPRLSVAEADADHGGVPSSYVDGIELDPRSDALDFNEGTLCEFVEVVNGNWQGGKTCEPKKHEGVSLNQLIEGTEGRIFYG
jgi:hypothetical protein